MNANKDNKNINSEMKKPVPLPRTKFEGKRVEEVEDENISDSSSSTSSKKRFGSGRNFIKKDWKAATDIIHGKGKIMIEASKTEVHNLEKKVKNVMMKRLSVNPKNSPDVLPKDYHRSQSLPCDEVFSSISFSSPLSECEKSQDEFDCHSSTEDESYYSTNTLPPPYPPPDLPDEPTLYDEVNPDVLYSTSTCSNSLYEDLSKFSSLQQDSFSEKSFQSSNDYKHKRCDSWLFYDSVQSDVTNRCEEELEDGASASEFSSALSSNTDDNQSEILPELKTFSYDLKLNSILSDLPDSPSILRRQKNSDSKNTVTSSVIFEFDPLFEQKLMCSAIENSDDTVSANLTNLKVENDKKNGEKKLNFQPEVSPVDIYSNVEIKFPSPLVPPPIPPRRFDSITNETVSGKDKRISNESSDSGVKENKNDDQNRKSSLTPWSKSIKEAMKKVTENFDNRTTWSPSIQLVRKNSKKSSGSYKNQICDGSELVQGESTFYSNISTSQDTYIGYNLNHSGVLYKSGGVQRWGQLLQRKLTIFNDKDSPEVKDTITLDGFLSLQLLQDRRMSVDGKSLDCFELSVANKKESYLFGTPTPYDRHVWMQKILESVIMSFPSKLTSDYLRAGWCYMKEGIGGEWTTTSILLSKRTLYLSPRNGSLQEADLRKARHLKLQDHKNCYVKSSERGPVILIDLADKTLYLQMNIVRETLTWEGVILCSSLSNGPKLCEQQLTKDDIPVIVDKCIGFIYLHGSLSEGIYRRSGSNTVVSKLISLFRRDSWSVQLTREAYSEYDVASVLKRFFRDLPDSVLTSVLRPEWCHIAECLTFSQEERVINYKQLIRKLPQINQATIKKLIGHLYFIHLKSEKNLMPVENLSAIWGPTLMHFEDDSTVSANWANTQASVVKDLITSYTKLFDIDDDELTREKTILNVLEKYHNSRTNNVSTKQSGDLKIWIYLHSNQDNNCVSLSITPQKLVSEVCQELSDKMNLPGHELLVMEVISNNMYRPLHYTERVLDTVLRWGYWDEQDRKDNSLVIKKNDFLQELAPMMKPPIVLFEELKFADRRMKGFKNFLFEFSQAKICLYKDKSCTTVIREWKVEDIIWFVGHETKRNPQSRWSITFIEKNQKNHRSKDEPYFGYTICGGTKEQQMKLISALLCGEYPNGVLQSPMLL